MEKVGLVDLTGNKLNFLPVNLVTDMVTADKAVCARHMPPGSDMIKLMKRPSKGYSADTCHPFWIVIGLIWKGGMTWAWAVWPKGP